MYFNLILLVISIIICTSFCDSLFKIEGKASVPYTASNDWLTEARILIDGGKYLAFFKLVFVK